MGGGRNAGNHEILWNSNQDVFKPKEHEPSHIHALYGEYIGIFDLKSLRMTAGDLPVKGQELVKEWLSLHQDELLRMWDTQNIEKLPPL